MSMGLQNEGGLLLLVVVEWCYDVVDGVVVSYQLGPFIIILVPET